MTSIFHRLQRWFKRIEKAEQGDFGNDISTPRTRRRALWHFNLFDHAFLRIWWTNLYQLRPGVWRSNQPGPARVARYGRMGIKTILNFRAKDQISYVLLEQEACDAHGITMLHVPLSARSVIRPSQYLDLLAAFERIERPFLMHCKSGADRAGLASALYLLHVENAPLAVARQQLAPRFMHFRHGRTAILDYLLDCYAADMDRDGPIPIHRWFALYYNALHVQNGFAADPRRPVVSAYVPPALDTPQGGA